MRILLLKTRKQAAEQAMDLMSPKVLFSKQIEGSQANSEQQSGKFVELTNQRSLNEGGKRDMIDFLQFMLAGGTAKFIACVLAYPHGSFLTIIAAERWRNINKFNLKSLHQFILYCC